MNRASWVESRQAQENTRRNAHVRDFEGWLLPNAWFSANHLPTRIQITSKINNIYHVDFIDYFISI